MNQVGEFFGALPEVGRQLWAFMHDGGVAAVPVILGTALATALLLYLAKTLRAEHGWLSAIFGAMAATVGMFWVFGVIPSAWVYFVDGSRDVLEGAIIPGEIPGFSNFYQVFRDSVVMGLTAIGVVGLVMFSGAIQRKYPGALAEGEEARPQSGGYK